VCNHCIAISANPEWNHRSPYLNLCRCLLQHDVIFPLRLTVPRQVCTAFDKDDNMASYASKPVAYMQDSNIHPVPKCINSDQVYMDFWFNTEENTGMRTQSISPSNSNICDPSYLPVQNQDSVFVQSVVPDQQYIFSDRRMDPLFCQDGPKNSMPLTVHYAGSDFASVCTCSIGPHSVHSSSGSEVCSKSKNVAGSSNFVHTNNISLSSTSSSGNR
jgi:hypothetical protein